MKEISMKTAFGKELAYTSALSKNLVKLQEICDLCGLNVDVSTATIFHQYKTPKQGKIVDIVIEQGDAKIAIESQDASGWLDINHLCKTLGYGYEINATDLIVLCQNSSEHMRQFARDENVRSQRNISIIENKFIQDSNGDIDTVFVAVARAHEVRRRQPSKRRTTKAIKTNVKGKFPSYAEVFKGQFPINLTCTSLNKTVEATMNDDLTVTINGVKYKSLYLATVAEFNQSVAKKLNRAWQYKDRFLIVHQIRYDDSLLSETHWAKSFLPENSNYEQTINTGSI